jgi:hypothetical protein
MTNRYKIRNYTGEGQGMMTRGQGILRHINIGVHSAKLHYRYCRAALLTLRGHGKWEEEFKVLDDDDVRALNERALTKEEKEQTEHWAKLGGAFVEGGIARAAGLAAGEGSHTLSWIWYSAGKPLDEDDPKLHDGMDFHKVLHEYLTEDSPSSATGMVQDVRLLREEMRRTIAFGYTKAAKWDELAGEELAGSEAEVTEGRRAYAAEHAATERRTCAMLERKWAGILAKADAYLEGTVALDTEAVTIELDLEDELDPEAEEARLEAEEEEE